MRIAVIGKGNVGGTLGKRWLQAGHQVVFGSRSPKESDELLVADAVATAEVVVLAVPYSGLVETARSLDLGDKVLIDCTNPITPDFSGVSAAGGSAAEELAKQTGSNRVVKCFNTVGFNIMAKPDFGGRGATMLYCGDDPEAKDTAAQLATDIGFSPIDAGPLLQARWLESLAWLWISMALKFGHGTETAFFYEKR